MPRFRFLLAALLFPVAALAAPAPWYKWASRSADIVTCAQASPGEGWERLPVPYRDSRCMQPR